MTRRIKSYYTAAELADMQLTGLPKSKGKLLARAAKEGWATIEDTGIGGTRRLLCPPQHVLDQIAVRITSEWKGPAGISVKPQELQLALVETSAQALVADARKGVVEALRVLMEGSRYPMKTAARTLLDMARSGQASPQIINMLRAARDGRGRQSVDGLPAVRSLLRFVEYDQNGALAPQRRQADMSVPSWAPAFMALYQKPEKPTVAHAYRQYCDAADANATLPSVHQVHRFLQKVGNVSRQAGRMGDRELKSLKPFWRRDFKQLLPTDIYSADGHKFDAEVQHPMHGRPFRPEITSVVDIATRRAVGWSVGLNESGFVVSDALRDAVLRAGIPAVFYVDNGSGYRNELMEDTATGLMARLGIEMINSLPYNSQARGVIERLHQTIWVRAAKEITGYIGADMDRQERQAQFKLSRKAIAKPGEAISLPLMGWDAFVAFAEQKVDQYNNRPHRSLPKVEDPNTGRRRHMTPNEAWAKHVAAGFAAHVVSDDEARPLFRPQQLRTINRGEINLFGNRYFSRALEEFHGDQMAIGYDIHDASKVWVYDDDGRFVCNAELNGNTQPYLAPTVMERARDKRLAGRIRNAERHIEEMHLERRGAPALENMEQVVIPGLMNLSREQLAARAEQLRSAEVVEARPVLQPVPAAAVAPEAWSAPDEPAARYAEWLRVSQLPDEQIESEKQRNWRVTYQKTPEFRAYALKSA
jgi:putative transposase